jgi:hypothetical protein
MLLNLGAFALLPDRHHLPSRPSRSSSGARLLSRRTVSRQPLCSAANSLPSAPCCSGAFRWGAAFTSSPHLVSTASFPPSISDPRLLLRGVLLQGGGRLLLRCPPPRQPPFFGVDFGASAAPSCRLPAQWAGSNFPPPSRQPLFAAPFSGPAPPDCSGGAVATSARFRLSRNARRRVARETSARRWAACTSHPGRGQQFFSAIRSQRRQPRGKWGPDGSSDPRESPLNGGLRAWRSPRLGASAA